jgi:hypothetical protein
MSEGNWVGEVVGCELGCLDGEDLGFTKGLLLGLADG